MRNKVDESSMYHRRDSLQDQSMNFNDRSITYPFPRQLNNEASGSNQHDKPPKFDELSQLSHKLGPSLLPESPAMRPSSFNTQWNFQRKQVEEVPMNPQISFGMPTEQPRASKCHSLAALPKDD